jgi:hypothetical protein
MSVFRSARPLHVVLLAMVLVALTMFVAIGVLGLARSREMRDAEFSHLYIAGKVWRSGKNPYNRVDYVSQSNQPHVVSFGYRPASAALAIPIAGLTYDRARNLVRACTGVSPHLKPERRARWVNISPIGGSFDEAVASAFHCVPEGSDRPSPH